MWVWGYSFFSHQKRKISMESVFPSQRIHKRARMTSIFYNSEDLDFLFFPTMLYILVFSVGNQARALVLLISIDNIRYGPGPFCPHLPKPVHLSKT